MFTLDVDRLKAWFLAEKRDLPWRQNQDPYAIWISEVMLQQTQVAVVIPYFLRWMERFPTVQSLAEASLDEVIKMWEGLGYYSRARHLHEGAKWVADHFSGQLPQDEEQLKKIKGLGPYTIGAILSFAFHQKKAAVDGNVLRVLARYFQIWDDIAKPSTLKQLRLIAEQVLPDIEPWLVNEALIELGATICQRKSQCSKCPLQSTCASYRDGTVSQLPIKSKGAKTEYLYRSVAILTYDDLYLIKRGEKGKIMSDLYEFPFFEVSSEGWTSNQLKAQVEARYGVSVEMISQLPSVSHSFTRYQVRLDPVLFRCSERQESETFEWKSWSQLQQLAFSSGHRRIIHHLEQNLSYIC